MPLVPYKAGSEGVYLASIASGARTANGNNLADSSYGPVTAFVLYVNVTAVSGTTPTLVVKLQDSPDGGVTWYDVTGAATGTLNATGTTSVRFNATATPMSDQFRVAWVIGGTTPSFTFKVDLWVARA